MAGGIKTKYKLIGAALVVGGLLAVAKFGGFIPKVAGMKALVPQSVGVQNADVAQGAPSFSYDLPIEPVSSFQGCPKVGLLAWNAESAITVANGGPSTTASSPLKKYSGGCLTLERQDDYSVMQQNMLKFAQAYATGKDTSQGYAITMIMGDALPSYMAALQPQLARIHQSAEVIGVVGFSYGEDKCMGRDLKGNPQTARGSLIAAVPRDGDQNVCNKFASDNNIPVNVDQRTYDKDAINYLDADSFVIAGQKFLAKTCVQRQEVSKGLLTGKTVNVCVDGVATWTPGDVTVAKGIADEQKAGGTRVITTWASTHDYNQEMPAVLIANKQWADDNRQFVVGVLRSADRAAFAIRTNPDSLHRLGEINANVFGGGGDESNPDYWSRYFVGEDFTDNLGNKNHLGGSRVITLAEARDYLGQGQGGMNVYKAAYETFGNLFKTLYPKDIPSYPAYDTVVDPSFVVAALGSAHVENTGQKFESGAITRTVSHASYSIEFVTGSSAILPKSAATLRQILNAAALTSLRLKIDGYTDSTGDPDKNQELSRERAQAVADWLHEQAPSTFPADRMSVHGYGQDNPVCTEDTSKACLAKNRRVEITMGE